MWLSILAVGCAGGTDFEDQQNQGPADSSGEVPRLAPEDPAGFPDIPQEMELPCETLLLANGDFEKGRDGSWAETVAQNESQLIYHRSELKRPVIHEGDHSVVMGGIPRVEEFLVQDFIIPAGTQAVLLSGYHYVEFRDAAGIDAATVSLTADTGDTLVSLTLSASDFRGNANWERFERTVNITGVEQSGRLEIRARTQSFLSSAVFGFDTFSVYALRCGGEGA